MKFRAKLTDVVCVTRLSNVVSTLAKNVKTCVLRLSPDKVCFVISERGSMNMWCELSQMNFFTEYRIEGRDDRNEIYLELHVEQLARTLRHAHNAITVKIKLTKRNGAYLTIDITQPTVTGGSRSIVHEVPVTVVPPRLWVDYEEPDMPDIDVSIYLPPLKQLKTIIDRMKSLDNYITLSANMSGELQVKLETDIVTATTYFKDLPNHKFEPADTDSNPTVMYEARVDIKKLSHVLTGNFNPAKVICNIVDGRGLQFFLLHQDVSLQYYIPAISI